MPKCCGKTPDEIPANDPCNPPSVGCSGSGSSAACHGSCAEPIACFHQMIDRCYEYAVQAKDEGRPIVGIMCEFTPREIVLAAGAVPVCLCGGDASTIPAAETQLPQTLCPLIKSTFGYHVEKSNPFLEMADLVVAETTCDGKKKMFELMAESHPMHVLELPQKPDDPDAFDHWLKELAKLKAILEDRFSVAITDEKLREAARTMNRERALRRELAELMAQDEPPLSGRELLELKSSISGIPADLAMYRTAIEKFKNAPACGRHLGRVRVMMTGVPMAHGAERVLDLVEDHGGLVVVQENCTGVKPLLEDVDAEADDILRAIAEKYIHLPCSVMTPNTARMQSIRDLADKYNVECIVDLVWQACLTYDVESYYTRRLADELGLPYLRVMTDYSPSDSARIAVRLEALFEQVLARREPSAQAAGP